MARSLFNQAGTLSYTVTVGHDAQPVEPYAIVSARLYRESPTDAQRDDSSNALAEALQSITSWTPGRSLGEKLIAYAAVSDLEPTGNEDYEILYWVISYRLESGGVVINDIEPTVFWRAEGIQGRFDVSKRDLIAVEGKLENLISAMTLASKITLADRLVRQELRSKSLDVEKLAQVDAKDLVVYRALVLCCMDLSKEREDSWATKAMHYEEFYKTLRDGIAIGYDRDDDGDIEPGAEDGAQLVAVGFFAR